MVFLYMTGAVEITSVTNFAFTLSALIFSISSAIDTFANDNKIELKLRFIFDTLAIGVAVIIPNLKNTEIVNLMMSFFDTNVLLLLALFFTLAGQWAIEIKLKDMQNKRK